MARAVQDLIAAVRAPLAPFQTLTDLIPSSAGDRECLLEEDKAPCSYAAAAAFARRLALPGVARGDVVCTCLPNGACSALAFWAVSAGATYAPLNPALTREELVFELQDLPAALVIVLAADPRGAVVARVCEEHGVRVATLTPDEETAGLFTLDAGGEAAAPGTASDRAMLLHTSGTTKKPKIVPLTHGNLGAGMQYVARTLRRAPEDVCLNVMPLFHIHGIVANVGASVLSEARVACSAYCGGEAFVDELADGVAGGVPTWYSAVPTMHHAILEAAEARGAALRHALTLMRNCSAALLPPVSRRFQAAFGRAGRFEVVPTYAMTESFPIASNPPSLEVKLASVGPAMGPDVTVRDDAGARLPAGVEGEVCVAGPCVTAGYLMRDHMAADPNVEAHHVLAGGRVLRTGDKGYVDADGYLHLVGRFKEIINVCGEKISPLAVEEVLLDVPGVATCVCFAAPADECGEVVGVACVAAAGATPTLAALRAACRGRVAQAFHPRVLVRQQEIVKGPTGKPKRIGLAQQLGVPPVRGHESVAEYTYDLAATSLLAA